MINKPTISRCLVSFISVLFAQFTLALLPLCFPNSSCFILLPLSVVLLVIVTGLGGFCKKILGVKASAPAFVIYTIFFLWAVYIYVIRLGVSTLFDVVFNALILILIIGLSRFMSSDPGFVNNESPSNDPYVRGPDREVEIPEEVSPIDNRAKYCKACKTYVVRFDHHCPAFGNCIGQKNHLFFVLLVMFFIVSEASFTACAYQHTARSQRSNKERAGVSQYFVKSSMVFCLIQLLWQVAFIKWHIYCACFNIKTDEWINWKKYPEFHVYITSPTGQSQAVITQFRNPYHKGVVMNLKEFLAAM